MKTTITNENQEFVASHGRAKRYGSACAAGWLILSSILSACSLQPEPLEAAKMEKQADKLAEDAYSAQEAIDAPLTIYEAQARAIKYNLDARIKVMEQAVSKSNLDISKLDLLPKLTASAGYSYRDNEPGARSVSLDSGRESLEFSKSSERVANSYGVGVSWNILDFGLGYVRAQQEADKVLITEERKRTVVHDILRDTRTAFWKAAIAQKTTGEVKTLLKEAQVALDRTKRAEASKLISPFESLQYQQELLGHVKRLQDILSSLASAKMELAALINLRPDDMFLIATNDEDLYQLPKMKLDLARLEHTALMQRPEIREETLKHRIQKKEIQKVWLSILPSLSTTLDYNYDSNDFLFNNNWGALGVRVASNLVNVATAPMKADHEKDNLSLIELRQQAYAVAIITQVNLAYLDHRIGLKSVRLLDEIAGVSSRYYTESRNHFSAGTLSEQRVISAGVDSLAAQVQRDFAYAELQNSFGKILRSAGIDVMSEPLENMKVATIASSIEKNMKQLSRSGDPTAAFDLSDLADFSSEKAPVQVAVTEIDTQSATPTQKQAASGKNFGVQLGAFSRKENAERLLKSAPDKITSLKTLMASIAEQPNAAGETLYSVRFNGLSKEGARGVCRDLLQAGDACQVISISPQQASLTNNNETRVRLGAFASEDNAKRALKMAQSKLPSQATPVQRVEPVQGKQRPMFVAYMAGLPQTEAQSYCEKIIESGMECLVE